MTQALVYKYSNEFILEFASVDRLLYRISDREDLEKHVPPDSLQRLDECHIYILGKRPRISLLPSTISTNDEILCFSIDYKLKGTLKQASVRVPRSLIPSEEIFFEASPYPHRELVSRNAKGEIIVETVLANFVDFIPDLEREVKDIEVLYIGKGLRKSANDRLANHSTVQAILAELNSNDPDAEVFAMVYQFKYRKNCLQFLNVPVEVTGKLAKEHTKKCVDFRPSLESQVSVVEALMISYFQTNRFNTHYLDSPSRTQKVFDDIYDADFAAMEIVLDNTNTGGQRLFSGKVSPQSVHNILVDFRELEGRTSFIRPH